MTQLWGAIGAVFSSWMNDRAIAYRKMYDIPESWGTAVNVQPMVFGNMGEDSGTGVAFTRDAATGENIFYGEYLMNAQGEDVVAGTRTPLPIAELAKDDPEVPTPSSSKIRHTLEKHYTDMMDIEFTIQQGKLYMLQCRVGKRTAFAAIKIAVDMVDEKLIDEKEALTPDRARPAQPAPAGRSSTPRRRTRAIKGGRLLAKGLNAGPGAATGRIVFNSDRRRGLGQAGREGHPDPHRDLARGHQGHERRRGHPDRPRRHDLPRGARRPPDGPGLRRRLRRPGHRLRQAAP